jgi:transcriptional regulator with XRE-family HTH domain
VPSLSVHDLGGYLREQRESARLSLRQLSELAGVSNPYLSQIERGLKKPSAEILGQLAKGLRISAESLYVRAGILEEREDHLALETAVLAEPHLTERQKQVLLDIYESFRAENARGEADSSPEPEPISSGATRAALERAATKKAATQQAATKSAAKATKATAKAQAKATTKATTRAKATTKATTKTAARATKRAAKTTQKAAAAAGQTVVRTVAPQKETP